MISHGFEVDLSGPAVNRLEGIRKAARELGEGIQDLTDLLWCSIDNDDSRDLDQLTVAERLPGGRVKIPVAVADVEVVIKSGT